LEILLLSAGKSARLVSTWVFIKILFYGRPQGPPIQINMGTGWRAKIFRRYIGKDVGAPPKQFNT
jgi:hypothetical protein